MLFLVLVGIFLSDFFLIVRQCLLYCFRSFDVVDCCFNDMFALFLSILGMNIKIAIVSSPFSFFVVPPGLLCLLLTSYLCLFGFVELLLRIRRNSE